MSKRIITIFGATGKTGGGMINYLLKDGTFAARGVTRNPDSPSAQALAARGVEVVQGDLDDPTTINKVVQGAYGVFGVTDYWTAFEKEEKQGKDMVDAARKAGVKHFVWTTLDHSEWRVPHFETKARVNDYLVDNTKDGEMGRTSLYLGFFLENFRGAFKRENQDGKIHFQTMFKTDGKLPVISALDIGGWALEAFKNPNEWLNKDMKVTTEYITPREVAKLAGEVFEEEVVIKDLGEEAWMQSRNPRNEELWLNIQLFYTDGAQEGYRDVEMSRRVLPEAKTAKEMLQEWGKGIVH